MFDSETFLTRLYVMCDDFFKQIDANESHPGPAASLSISEVVTLALFGQWFCFGSERGFYRWACNHLRSAFPTLPDRSQFNRLVRHSRGQIERFALWLARQHDEHDQPLYEILDQCPAVTRDRRRRGTGWLAGQANIGISQRLGWFTGFHILDCCTPWGQITGFGVAPASTKEQPMTEAFFAARSANMQPTVDRSGPMACPSAGVFRTPYYLADKGFSGPALHRRWQHRYCTQMVCAPQRRHGPQVHGDQSWPKSWRVQLASLRQIIESVHEALLHRFGLANERPHTLEGFLARLAARVGLHNFCIRLNQEAGRNNLAFADLIAW